MLRYPAIPIVLAFGIGAFSAAFAQGVTPLTEKNDNRVQIKPAIADSHTHMGMVPVQINIKPCKRKPPPYWCDENKKDEPSER